MLRTSTSSICCLWGFVWLFSAGIASSAPCFGEDVVSLRLVASLEGHTDQVREVVFSADGQTLASCSHDGTIRLWHVESKKLITTLTVQDEPLYALSLSPDGKTLATGGHGGTLTLWDIKSHLKTGTFQPAERRIDGIVWSPDGNTVVVQDDHRLVSVPTNGDKPTIIDIKFEEPTFSGMAVARDGERIAVGGQAATLVVWNSKQNKIVSRFTALPDDVKNWNNLSVIMATAFSPTEDRVAVSSGFKIASTVTSWGVEKKDLATRFTGDYGTVWGIAFSPDGKLLAGAGDRLVIWNSQSGAVLDTWHDENLARLKLDSFHAYKIAFSPNGRLIASGGFDKTVKLFSVYEK